jgi:DNA-binding transcriptional ArsR family regulator
MRRNSTGPIDRAWSLGREVGVRFDRHRNVFSTTPPGRAYTIGMNTAPLIAEIAALVAEPARAAMLSALLDGRALTAGELAYAARVTPQTASTHLGRRTETGLLSPTREGRHRYFRRASPKVVERVRDRSVGVEFGAPPVLPIVPRLDRTPAAPRRGTGSRVDQALFRSRLDRETEAQPRRDCHGVRRTRILGDVRGQCFRREWVCGNRRKGRLQRHRASFETRPPGAPPGHSPGVSRSWHSEMSSS